MCSLMNSSHSEDVSEEKTEVKIPIIKKNNNNLLNQVFRFEGEEEIVGNILLLLQNTNSTNNAIIASSLNKKITIRINYKNLVNSEVTINESNFSEATLMEILKQFFQTIYNKKIQISKFFEDSNQILSIVIIKNNIEILKKKYIIFSTKVINNGLLIDREIICEEDVYLPLAYQVGTDTIDSIFKIMSSNLMQKIQDTNKE